MAEKILYTGEISMVYIGIDPGASGGIAFKTPNTVGAVKMPGTDTDILSFLKEFKGEGQEVYVLMEKVSGFIGKRKRVIQIVCPRCNGYIPFEIEEGDPASRMFTFGEGYGHIRGVCQTLGFILETPMVPRSWQKIHGLYKDRGMSQTIWKNILKDRAQKLFPDLKVTLKTADALLILDVLTRIPRF